MSDFIRTLASNAVVIAARDRDEKQFFGQGWSHYPKAFQHALNGVNYYLSVYNTPNHTQVNWNLKDEAMPFNGAGYPEWPLGETWLLFALTPEESRTLAAEIGLPFADWLEAALAACRSDVTAEAMARAGNVVDLPNFHASRAGDDQ